MIPKELREPEEEEEQTIIDDSKFDLAEPNFNKEN